ncbi:uncharacterized protein LY79DRAFT_114375 [Colletotrichum navitas]|uniref:Uncharacterized protein n=1 Tax=Colletotrichum navitas TaxID=681940 RepID=A0AAD8Q383_9PEZI|nr:uncharacterized protein LY79DRAFT_114375 [Colletotrichum navitas]KAK1594968.1 hypothetical protein LY79DRAFT_114375 [Colletotrichum navitas]
MVMMMHEPKLRSPVCCPHPHCEPNQHPSRPPRDAKCSPLLTWGFPLADGTSEIVMLMHEPKPRSSRKASRGFHKRHFPRRVLRASIKRVRNRRRECAGAGNKKLNGLAAYLMRPQPPIQQTVTNEDYRFREDGGGTPLSVAHSWSVRLPPSTFSVLPDRLPTEYSVIRQQPSKSRRRPPP